MRKSLLILTILSISTLGLLANQNLGKKIEKNGLNCKKIVHTIDGKEISSNKIELNDTLKIKFKDVTGFTTKNDKIYPGLMIKVISPEGKQILFAKNALAAFSEKGINKIVAKALTATIATGPPMKNNKTYTAELKLFDAAGKGQIDYKTNFTIQGVNKKESIPTGQIIPSGLTIQQTVLAKDNKPSKYEVFSVGDKIQFFLLNVEGFKKGDDGLYHFDIDLKLKDSNDKVIYQAKELFKEAGHLDLKDGTLKSPVVNIYTTDYPPGKYTAEVTIYDQNSNKRAKAVKTFGLFDLKSN